MFLNVGVIIYCSAMVSQTDQEDHCSKKRGHNMLCRATEGSNGVSREAEGVGGKCGQEPLLWFPWKGTGEAG